ncbi:sugar ABC transporter ATP-binding protein [uncultured Cohaesibacter sp.]|uniref:sugar ABC transporter ATP-binding protein n=1 Tax=uncultured Cohaesibacter sp. TaxID=1002546 RepID=UPI0029C8CF6D|nr:sugar ABC transporter ATP-binding protein [uncultured Cohaesibacter sp.]
MLLDMKDIRKSFGPIEILHGVNFNVQHGEIHALVGHNGAGKSTLMKVLGGNFADYSGGIEIEGKPLSVHSPGEAIDQGIAMIYQDFSLVPEMTVAQNIALGREPEGALPGTVDHAEIDRRSAREAKELAIDLPMNMPIKKLGVASQQLTEIVRACSRNVRVLVMDEPTARLAPNERKHLFNVMRNMAKDRGVGIVYISHFLDEVIEVSDRVTVLRDGNVIESRPSSDYTVEALSALLVDKKEGDGELRSVTRHQVGETIVLEVKDLAFPGQAPTSLSIRAGEVLGLAGLIGSGRTRLARALIGDLESRGQVIVGGLDITRRSPQKSADCGLVMVPEDRKISGLAPNASIEANIAVTALKSLTTFANFVSLGGRRAMANKFIREFGIRPPDPLKRVNKLSGGNAQKVLVARALAPNPKVLILDQPTAGVDVGAKGELHELLRLAASQGTAILLISDELEEIIGLSDRISVISEGMLQPSKPSSEFTPASLLAAMSYSAGAAAQARSA